MIPIPKPKSNKKPKSTRTTTVRQHPRKVQTGTTTVHRHTRNLRPEIKQTTSRAIRESWDELPIWEKLRIAKNQPPVSTSLLREDHYDGIDHTSTNTILYDEMLEQPRYHEIQKDRRYILQEMTADEYMRKVYLNFREGAKDSAINSNVTWASATYTEPDIVTKYADLMRKGAKFPMPTIDYQIHGQEGRHRVRAVQEAFGTDTKIPVMIIEPWSNWESDARRKYESGL